MRKKEDLLVERGSPNVGTDYAEINPAGQTFFDRVTSDRRKGPSPVFFFFFFNKKGNNNNNKNKTVRRLAN